MHCEYHYLGGRGLQPPKPPPWIRPWARGRSRNFKRGGGSGGIFFKKGGGGPTTYSGAICIANKQNLLKKKGGGVGPPRPPPPPPPPDHSVCLCHSLHTLSAACALVLSSYIHVCAGYLCFVKLSKSKGGGGGVEVKPLNFCTTSVAHTAKIDRTGGN